MKKIKLTESDLLKIVKRVIREQESENPFDRMRKNITNRVERRDIIVPDYSVIFDEILKPPFRRGNRQKDGEYQNYNRNNEWIGWLRPGGVFSMNLDLLRQIEHQIKLVFKFNPNTQEWWFAVKPHLKSWLEDKLNAKITYII